MKQNLIPRSRIWLLITVCQSTFLISIKIKYFSLLLMKILNQHYVLNCKSEINKKISVKIKVACCHSLQPWTVLCACLCIRSFFFRFPLGHPPTVTLKYSWILHTFSYQYFIVQLYLIYYTFYSSICYSKMPPSHL